MFVNPNSACSTMFAGPYVLDHAQGVMTKRAESLGERVREMRERRGMTQFDLALKVGVKDLAIGNLELGKTEDPKSSTLAKVALALGTTIDWLLHGDQATPPGGEVRVVLDGDPAPLGALEELEQVMEFLKVDPAYRQRIRDVRWQGGIPLSRGLLTQMVGELVAGYRGEEERAAGFARPKGGPQGQEITFPDEDG